ncbi:hypothetical protein [Parvularcula lutaonensis]|uniref:Uncharacterized protein n=1 Tax=Parvularcula lutaonensis TaxID=491923 RepID=A0ABV7M752_9PROT|nr:hypothetical protein [Parvularcula lutaonensis]GGY56788.1 hypothetical protein GCM10007148_27880 [Parvularcula lutaonensis]
MIPQLVDSGFNFVDKKLDAISGPSEVTARGSANDYFLTEVDGSFTYSINDGLGCVLIAVGGETSSNPASDAFAGSALSGLEGAFDVSGLPSGSLPKVYIEARIVAGETMDVFALEPEYIYYRKSLGSGWMRANRRDLIVDFSFDSAADPTARQTRLVIDQMRPGEERDKLALASEKAPWLPIFTPSGGDQQRLLSMCSLRTCKAQPFTLAVTVAETSNASVALQSAVELASTLRDVSRPQIEAGLAAATFGEGAYDPTDPQWVQRRSNARQACEKVAKVRSSLQSDLSAPERATVSALLNDAIDEAKAPYTAAGLDWWLVVPHAQTGCGWI